MARHIHIHLHDDDMQTHDYGVPGMKRGAHKSPEHAELSGLVSRGHGSSPRAKELRGKISPKKPKPIKFRTAYGWAGGGR